MITNDAREIAKHRAIRNKLGIPDFVCAQPFDEDVGMVWALRYKQDDQVISLEFVKQVLELKDSTTDYVTTVVEALIEHGREFEDIAEIPPNVVLAANDIARVTRRAVGNFVIVHESQKDAFEKMFPHAAFNGFMLRTSSSSKLLGKMIVTYKQKGDGQVDGGLILAYNENSGKHGFSINEVANYTRIMKFSLGLSSLDVRRLRKQNREQ
jgi:hypothetical protein